MQAGGGQGWRCLGRLLAAATTASGGGATAMMCSSSSQTPLSSAAASAVHQLTRGFLCVRSGWNSNSSSSSQCSSHTTQPWHNQLHRLTDGKCECVCGGANDRSSLVLQLQRAHRPSSASNLHQPAGTHKVCVAVPAVHIRAYAAGRTATHLQQPLGASKQSIHTSTGKTLTRSGL